MTIMGADSILSVMAHARPRKPWQITTASWLLWLALVNVAVGWCLVMWVETESVLFTGPALLLIATVTSWLGMVTRFGWAVVIGLMHGAMTVFLFVLVVERHWSPAEAHMPFIVMILAFFVLMAPLTVIGWHRRPAVFEPWHCQTCGYPLFGLSSPTCPECGLPFDRACVAAARPRLDSMTDRLERS